MQSETPKVVEIVKRAKRRENMKSSVSSFFSSQSNDDVLFNSEQSGLRATRKIEDNPDFVESPNPH